MGSALWPCPTYAAERKALWGDSRVVNRDGREVGPGKAGLDGADDDLGGDGDAETLGVEDEVVVVRVAGVDPVHGAFELVMAAVEVAGRASGCADGDAHAFGEAFGSNG